MKAPKPLEIKLHGIVKDVEQTELAPDRWSDGRNVAFAHGQARRTQGDLPFAEAGRLFPADVVKFVDNGVVQYWVYASATGTPRGIAATDGTTHWDLTPAGWPAIAGTGTKLTIGTINGFCFINHPEFGPYYWDNDVTHDMVKLPGWPANTTCKVMRAHKEFLMALTIDSATLGLVEGMVMWSASSGTGVPQEWTPSPTNDAGDKIFAEVGGALVEGVSERDQFFVMKNNFTGVLQYVGGQFTFASRTVFPSLGCLAPGAAVEAGNIIYMLTGNLEFVKHDGTTYQNVLYGVMQDYLRDAVNYQYPHMSLVYRDDFNGQVMIAYPTGTAAACTEAISYEMATGDCGIRDLPGITHVDQGTTGVSNVSWDAAVGTWDTDNEIWNQDASGYQPQSVIMAGQALGMLEVGGAIDFTTSSGRQPVASYLARAGINFDSWRNMTTISQAMPLLEGAQDDVINFTFGAQELIDGAVDLLPAIPYTVGKDKWLDLFLSTSFLYMQVDSTGGAPWQYGGVVTMVRRAGR